MVSVDRVCCDRLWVRKDAAIGATKKLMMFAMCLQYPAKSSRTKGISYSSHANVQVVYSHSFMHAPKAS